MKRTLPHDPETPPMRKEFYSSNIATHPKAPVIAAAPLKNSLNNNALTTQEINIAVLVSEGKTNSEIGQALFIAPGTVRNYVSSILSKLYLPNRAALAVYAIQNDLRGQAVRTYQDGPVAYNPDCYKDLLSMAIM